MNRLRWEDVRVLLTVDLDDPAIEPARGPATSGRTMSTPWRGSGPTARAACSIRRWATCRRRSRRRRSSATFSPACNISSAISPPMRRRTHGDDEHGAARGQPAATAAPPPSISQRPTGSSLGTIRVGASDNNIWFGWRVGVPTARREATVDQRRAPQDGSPERGERRVVRLAAGQRRGPQAARSPLQPGERNAVVRRLRELNQQVLSYRVTTLPSDCRGPPQSSSSRAASNAPLLVVTPAESLAELDALATEFNIGVAIESRRRPCRPGRSVEGRSARLGLAADMAAWMRRRTAHRPRRNARPAAARACESAVEPKGISDFFLEAYRAGIKPLSIVIELGRDRGGPGRGVDWFRTSDVAGDGRARADDAGLAGGGDSRARQARA